MKKICKNCCSYLNVKPQGVCLRNTSKDDICYKEKDDSCPKFKIKNTQPCYKCKYFDDSIKLHHGDYLGVCLKYSAENFDCNYNKNKSLIEKIRNSIVVVEDFKVANCFEKK